MASSREYPERPVVGVGGVIVDRGRTVLIRRGTEPLLGQWSIPGGTIEIGETLDEAVRRELLEETGLEVRVLDLIELFDRIYFDEDRRAKTRPPQDGFSATSDKKKPRYHFVIADYLCELVGGEPRAGSDVTDLAFAREDELSKFHLTEKATAVLKKAFAMSRARAVGQ
ncbi:MAG TPA: NUDIX hydrolase [Candidatus Acidoferrum sp.]|nr:NUDIX hydrolase [Candidatus Acidoferrum sp.]